MENITLGVVILNYITWDYTKQCISSIRNTEKKLDYRIYVVDNNSPVEPDEEFLSILKANDVVYLSSKINRGYASGNNIGIRHAIDDRCKYILISNSDIIFGENSIANMVEAFKIDNNIGIVGPQVMTENGTMQKSTIFFEGGLKQKYLAETWLRKIYPLYRLKCFGSDINYKENSFVYSVSGCCFIFSNVCASKITPLDENTFLYEEEEIIGKKMQLSGFKTLYYPESIVTHNHGRSTSYVKAFSYICRVNSEIYYCKNYLRTNIFLLIPLYFIRTFSFIVNAILKEDYRKNLFRYFRETWFHLCAPL